MDICNEKPESGHPATTRHHLAFLCSSFIVTLRASSDPVRRLRALHLADHTSHYQPSAPRTT